MNWSPQLGAISNAAQHDALAQSAMQVIEGVFCEDDYRRFSKGAVRLGAPIVPNSQIGRAAREWREKVKPIKDQSKWPPRPMTLLEFAASIERVATILLSWLGQNDATPSPSKRAEQLKPLVTAARTLLAELKDLDVWQRKAIHQAARDVQRLYQDANLIQNGRINVSGFGLHTTADAFPYFNFVTEPLWVEILLKASTAVKERYREYMHPISDPRPKAILSLATLVGTRPSRSKAFINYIEDFFARLVAAAPPATNVDSVRLQRGQVENLCDQAAA